MVKIAYVGDFLNHGKSLQTFGTSLVLLMSRFETVDSIDVFCPKADYTTEEFFPPSKLKINNAYRYDDAISLLGLLKIPWNVYDAVIFSMIPTGFGDSSLANATGLMLPILLSRFLKKKNIKVIYHNSALTNDVAKLGYNSMFDGIRTFLLTIVERNLFRNVKTFVLFDLYKHRIDNSVGRNRVGVLDSRYLEAVATLYMNNALDVESAELQVNKIPIILMHGFWGPQKNIELGLSALRHLKEQGITFKLIISGGINHHFPEYERKFNELLSIYSDVIYEYIGSVNEKMIMNLFLNTDLLILPYNTPGGHSGVLEQAIFFEIPTIAIDFPEYREQAEGFSYVKLVSPEMIPIAVLDMLNSKNNKSALKIRSKILQTLKSQECLLL